MADLLVWVITSPHFRQLLPVAMSAEKPFESHGELQSLRHENVVVGTETLHESMRFAAALRLMMKPTDPGTHRSNVLIMSSLDKEPGEILEALDHG